MTAIYHNERGGFNPTTLWIKYPQENLPSGKRNSLKVVIPVPASGSVSGAIANRQNQSTETNGCGGNPLNAATVGKDRHQFAGGKVVQGNQTMRNARKRRENQGTAEGISEAAKAMRSAETVTNNSPASIPVKRGRWG